MRLKWFFFFLFSTVVLNAQLVDKRFPKLSLPNVFTSQKQTIDLLLGKYILVQVWASWCPVCRKENKGLADFYRYEINQKDSQIGIFSISLDGKQRKKEKTSNPRKTLLDAIEKDKLNWPYHVADFKGWESYAVTKLRVRQLPKWLLVSPKGIVLKEHINLTQLRALNQQIKLGKSNSQIEKYIKNLPKLSNRKGTRRGMNSS